MAKLLNLEHLAAFKKKQDDFNAGKFMQIQNYVDGNGLIKADKIQNEKGVEVVIMHVDASDPLNVKYFADDGGNRGATEIAGEKGKIYIDAASGCKMIYTFDGENFIPFASQIATDEDIENLFRE